MTMYLPNPGLRPTGFEPGEFIEVTRMGDDVPPATRGANEPQGHTAVPMNADTRRDATRSVPEDISDLVEHHNGDPTDLRTANQDLPESRLADHDGCM